MFCWCILQCLLHRFHCCHMPCVGLLSELLMGSSSEFWWILGLQNLIFDHHTKKNKKKLNLGKSWACKHWKIKDIFNFAMFLALGSHFVIMCFCMCLSFLFCGDILLSFGFVFYCHFGLENDNEMQNQMTTKWQRKTEMTTHAKPNDKNMPEKRQKYIFNNPQSLLVRFS